MNKIQQNDKAPFQRISAACRITGLSQTFLRNGCRDGSIPCCMSGTTYYVNVPALLRKLGVSENKMEDTK